MEFEDVESALLRHPRVRRAVVLVVVTEPAGATPVAYVETDDATAEQIRAHLTDSGLLDGAAPRVIVPLRALPLTDDGSVDRAALPQPPLTAAVPFGKHGAMAGGRYGNVAAAVVLTALGFGAALFFTDLLWPGSTDTRYVPSPWSGLFHLLYYIECLSFGAGLAFLVLGRAGLARLGRSAGWTTLAHLAIVWLLIAWWPQDNFYRLAGKFDWEQQAALVYGFNVTLMLAAAVLAGFAATSRRPD